jgi:hypothetical protein
MQPVHPADQAPPPPQSLWAGLREAIRGTNADYTKIPLRRAVFLLAVPMVLELVLESTFAVVDICARRCWWPFDRDGPGDGGDRGGGAGWGGQRRFDHRGTGDLDRALASVPFPVAGIVSPRTCCA